MTQNGLISRALRIACLAGLSSSAAFANVQLPAIISDHMILQKSAKTPIWGKADPGEDVTVTLAKYTGKAKADADGKWRINLDLKDATQGPFELVIQGKDKVTIADVLVGEVWVASGQSNMEFTLKGAMGAEQEIPVSANPQLRQYLVAKDFKPVPVDNTKGQWTIADPKTSAGFTAVGYYFGKKLQNDLKVPVGIVHASWGGTPCEAWMSSEGFDRNPDLKAGRDRAYKQIADFPGQAKRFIGEFSEWLKATAREDRPTADVQAFAGEAVATDGWAPAKLPGVVKSTGATWLRKEVEVPENAAKRPLALAPGPIDETNNIAIYWNGKLVKELTYKDFGVGRPRGRNVQPHQVPTVAVPADLVKAGKNILAIRAFSPVAPVTFAAPIKAGLQTLNNDWVAKTEFEIPALTPTEGTPPKIPAAPDALWNTASYLFNAMIQPILPYGIHGVIWYQGESNVMRAFQYRTAFPLMIEDWRQHWGQGDFPFYFCQLANFTGKPTVPTPSNWAELREAQNQTLKLPKTGQAVLIDLGDSKNIHPTDKKNVGERLALIALANDYGKQVTFSGPVFESQKIEGGKIRLKFTHADGGLVAKPVPATYSEDSAKAITAPLVRNSPNSELEGFAVCGVDQKWVWADAKIDNGTVVVGADAVSNPVAVRYGWAHNPTCNLYNGAGLPASPFRTDDFPWISKDAKY